MEEAKQLFKKLKIHTLLDLALIVPVSYSDTTLSNSLEIGKVNTLEAKVEDVSVFAGKLRVQFRLVRTGKQLSSIFFHSTPYHHKQFSIGSDHVIQGRLEDYKGHLQMSQPKSIREAGKIIPVYKTVLKEKEVQALMACYINEKNLYGEGLESHEVATMMRIHFPRKKEDIFQDGKWISQNVMMLKFIEAYNHLKKLKGKRIDFPALYALDGEIKSFAENLPFVLTPEQHQVINQIQHDIARNDKAAKRMVVGDVGSGKTMVMLAGAMMAHPYKSILMAPTSLLALQLYEEACKYLPKKIKTALVMQGKEEGEYKKADFIIGTHALLYKEDLPQAALVMVDEQHRFGSKQRQRLESLVSSQEKKPHFIQFSATPIPRTQAMMESELIDVSLITMTPFEREVSTKTIGKQDFGYLLKHITEEITQKHQVLIIYPLVQESREVPYQSLEEARGFWEKRFKGVYMTHGKDKEKEEVLLKFREQGNILLATTVVEVGISLPRLTLIVIVGAERLGLATLHQLRGRVGRNGLKSWCYLYSHAKTENSRLERFAQTANGFDIAKLDLQFRNSGDILDGTIQSGQKFKWLDLAQDEDIVKKAKDRLRSIENKKQ